MGDLIPWRRAEAEVATCCPDCCDGTLDDGTPISRGAFLARAKLYGGLAALGVLTWTMATSDADADAAKPKAKAKPKAGKAKADKGQPRIASTASARQLLRHRGRKLDLAPWAEQDLRDGIVDERLIDLLGHILDTHTLAVSVFKTRHSRCVAGSGDGPDCNVSQHYTGHAADIWKVDGRLVRASHRGALRIVAALARLDPADRPTEVGSPFSQFSPLKGFFTDAAHDDHLHLGVAR